jgi:hypothetical protein
MSSRVLVAPYCRGVQPSRNMWASEDGDGKPLSLGSGSTDCAIVPY